MSAGIGTSAAIPYVLSITSKQVYIFTTQLHLRSDEHQTQISLTSTVDKG